MLLAASTSFKLAIVSNPKLKYLETLRGGASEFLRPRVEFNYDLPHEEVARELETTSRLRHPTQMDTSPNIVKEEVVAGVPMVASFRDGIPDYAIPVENGLLFPVDALESSAPSA